MHTWQTIDAAKRSMTVGHDVPWLLHAQAHERPDKPFLVWEPFDGPSRTWSYAEFEHDVAIVAAHLQALGLAPGDRVLIHLENSPEFLLTWFACAAAGAVAVSTNTQAMARDIAYFADHVSAALAVTSPRFAPVLAQACPTLGHLIVTDHDAGTPASPVPVPHIPFNELLAETDARVGRATDPLADLAIQFTSGTTSRPKAVVWTHANAIWAGQVNVAHMRLRSDDVVLIVLPLFHTNAQSYSMISTLWAGGTIVLQPRFSASRFWDVSVRQRVTWCSMVPFCARALLAQPPPPGHAYRFWAPAVKMRRVESALGIPTLPWWGMTETVAHGIVGTLDHPTPSGTIGRPSPAYEINVRDDAGAPIRPGESGRLFIRGVRGISLFKEYLGDPEATESAFDASGWFDTGDIVSMDTEGNLFFKDRANDVLKVGGENVAASEVEAAILETGLVAECAVVGQSHPMLDEVPVAFVVPSGEVGELEQRLRNACEEGLAPFKVPHAFHIVDELPRAALDKVAKAELRRRLLPAPYAG